MTAADRTVGTNAAIAASVLGLSAGDLEALYNVDEIFAPMSAVEIEYLAAGVYGALSSLIVAAGEAEPDALGAVAEELVAVQEALERARKLLGSPAAGSERARDPRPAARRHLHAV
jgi:hypothetical protein